MGLISPPPLSPRPSARRCVVLLRSYTKADLRRWSNSRAHSATVYRLLFFGVVGKERRPEIRERMRMAMACVGGKGKEWVQKRRRREERVCTSSSSSSFKARMLVASCGRRRRSLWPPGERALGQGKKKKAVCGGGSESLQAILSLAGGCEGRKTREKTRRRR